jgi:hypothetical protein
VLKITLDQRDGRKALVLRSPLNAFPLRLYADAPMRFFTLTGATFAFSAEPNERATQVQFGDATFSRIP